MTISLDAGLTQQIKQLAHDNRMDLVGIAPVYRFAHAPKPVRPQSHLPEAKAVVSMAIRFPYALFENAGKGDADSLMGLEVYQNTAIGLALSRAALRVARALEDAGYAAIPMCVSGKWSVRPHKGIETEWMADFSNRHAAVAAGLGEFGLHGLAITPQFGTRQRFVSVITSAPLLADPMYSGAPLCDRCMLCVNRCPMKALDPRAEQMVDFVDRKFTYMKADHWRCAWSEQTDICAEEGPKHFGIDYTEMPPEGPIDDAMMLQAFYKKCNTVGLQADYTHAMGMCIRVCRPPHLRGKKSFAVEALSAAPY